jgi:hypothetical protein
MPIDNLEKDLPYGFFNQTSVNNFSKMTLDRNSYSKEALLNEIIKEKVTNNIFENKVFFNAIALYIEGFNPNNFTNFLTLPFFKLKNEKIKVVARIPELHSHLPIPDDLTNISPVILSMYPIFEGPTTLGIPKIGSIIQVTFEDVGLQSGPKYLGSDENSSYVGGGSQGSAENSAQQSNTNAVPPAGYENGKKTAEGFWYFDRTVPLDLIAIHESAGGGVERQAVVTELANKDLSVHYTIERDGNYKKHVEENFATVHGGGPGSWGRNINQRSVSIEIINKVVGSRASNNEVVVFPIWKEGTSGHILPTLKQVETCWTLVKEICQRNNIPMVFPANAGRILNFGRHREGPMILEKDSEGNTRETWDVTGIQCHKMWAGNRCDGPFAQNYCYIRSLGFDMAPAWDLMMRTPFPPFDQSRRVSLDAVIQHKKENPINTASITASTMNIIQPNFKPKKKGK